MAEKHYCLFTQKELIDKEKIEHVIPRALGGRIRSRCVTCSKFNEMSSVFDADLISHYKPMLDVLSPLLPSEFNAGELPVTLDNGLPAVMEKGITKLKKKVVAERYQSGKPKLYYLPDDPKLIKKVLKEIGKFDALLISEQLPGEIAYWGSTLLSSRSEISILKSVLCIWDTIFQEKCQKFVFTRSNNLQNIRNFIRACIQNPSSQIDVKELDKYYLGLQLDQSVIDNVMRFFKMKRGNYEHVIAISSNTALRSIDVLWDILGVTTHGIRLTYSWTGLPFCGLIVNPILRNGEVKSEIKLKEEYPLPIYKTPYKSFSCGSPPESDIPHVFAHLYEDAYCGAHAFIVNNASDYLLNNFKHYANATSSLRDLIIQHIQRSYKYSYPEQELNSYLENISQELKKWGNVPSQRIKTFNDNESAQFLTDYRNAFNALDKPFHRPSLFASKDISSETQKVE